MAQRIKWLGVASVGVLCVMGGPLSAPWQVAPAHAYSYAAAGKEPLIEAREAALTAIGAGDWAAAGQALEQAKAELDYLQQHHVPAVREHLNGAVAGKDEGKLRAALREAFAAEIERRLDGAKANLGDFQTSKVLVVKARRFLDSMAADLKPESLKAAQDGLNAALAAVGNPGVFGVGAKAPDADAFAKAEAAVKAALAK